MQIELQHPGPGKEPKRCVNRFPDPPRPQDYVLPPASAGERVVSYQIVLLKSMENFRLGRADAFFSSSSIMVEAAIIVK